MAVRVKNIYKPRYHLSILNKNTFFIYKASRLRGFINIRRRKLRRGGYYKRIVLVHNDMKWTVARRYFTPNWRRSRRTKKHSYKYSFYTKQQLRAFYGFHKEETFRNLFKSFIGGAKTNKSLFFSSLESRLDVYLYRMRFLPTIYACRQFVRYCGVRINKMKNKIPGTRVLPGDILQFTRRFWFTFYRTLLFRVYWRVYGLSLFQRRQFRKKRKQMWRANRNRSFHKRTLFFLARQKRLLWKFFNVTRSLKYFVIKFRKMLFSLKADVIKSSFNLDILLLPLIYQMMTKKCQKVLKKTKRPIKGVSKGQLRSRLVVKRVIKKVYKLRKTTKNGAKRFQKFNKNLQTAKKRVKKSNIKSLKKHVTSKHWRDYALFYKLLSKNNIKELDKQIINSKKLISKEVDLFTLDTLDNLNQTWLDFKSKITLLLESLRLRKNVMTHSKFRKFSAIVRFRSLRFLKKKALKFQSVAKWKNKLSFRVLKALSHSRFKKLGKNKRKIQWENSKTLASLQNPAKNKKINNTNSIKTVKKTKRNIRIFRRYLNKIRWNKHHKFLRMINLKKNIKKLRKKLIVASNFKKIRKVNSLLKVRSNKKLKRIQIVSKYAKKTRLKVISKRILRTFSLFIARNILGLKRNKKLAFNNTGYNWLVKKNKKFITRKNMRIKIRISKRIKYAKITRFLSLNNHFLKAKQTTIKPSSSLEKSNRVKLTQGKPNNLNANLRITKSKKSKIKTKTISKRVNTNLAVFRALLLEIQNGNMSAASGLQKVLIIIKQLNSLSKKPQNFNKKMAQSKNNDKDNTKSIKKSKSYYTQKFLNQTKNRWKLWGDKNKKKFGFYKWNRNLKKSEKNNLKSNSSKNLNRQPGVDFTLYLDRSANYTANRKKNSKIKWTWTTVRPILKRRLRWKFAKLFKKLVKKMLKKKAKDLIALRTKFFSKIEEKKRRTPWKYSVSTFVAHTNLIFKAYRLLYFYLDLFFELESNFNKEAFTFLTKVRQTEISLLNPIYTHFYTYCCFVKVRNMKRYHRYSETVLSLVSVYNNMTI